MEKPLIIPDIGTDGLVTIIDILVSPGQDVELEASILTLESDKATMDVPCPMAGKISSLDVAKGDKVKQGDVIGRIMIDAQATSPSNQTRTNAIHTQDASGTASTMNTSQTSSSSIIHVPDVGSEMAMPVIDLAINIGDNLDPEATLLTLEGDKATVDVPCPHAGQVTKIFVAVGDKLKIGDPICEMAITTKDVSTFTADAPVQAMSPTQPEVICQPMDHPSPSTPLSTSTVQPQAVAGDGVYAGPSVRRLAHHLGVDIRGIKGSGIKGRLTFDDLYAHVKQRLSSSHGQVNAWPFEENQEIDFDRFGPNERVELSRIKQLSGKHLHKNWVTIPHVTQFADADITHMQAHRQRSKAAAAKYGIKMTPLIYIMKAVVGSLKAFPQFNSSLAADKKSIILKHYYHIGVAVDTPNGLVVPVIRNVDQKNIIELAKELVDISQVARDNGLKPNQMQGSCFTISSLGGIGGTAFTPIINAPDVAILGLSKSQKKPIFDEEKQTFIPRLMLPLSLSYDHRVIDGAQGARFITDLAHRINDVDDLIIEDMLNENQSSKGDE